MLPPAVDQRWLPEDAIKEDALVLLAFLSNLARKRRTTLVVVCSALVALEVPMSAADAQSAERLDLARQLVTALKVDSTLADMWSLPSTVARDSARRSEVRKRVRIFYDKYVGNEAMRNEFAKIYAERFSADELRALVAYHSSPVAERFRAEQTAIFESLRALVTRVIDEHQQEFQEILFKPPADES